MPASTNRYQQPIGEALPHWEPRSRPARTRIDGRYCRLEPLDAKQHLHDLYSAYSAAPDDRDWTYLVAGPFKGIDDYRRYLEQAEASADPLHYAVIDLESGAAVGTLSLMRIDLANGVIEVGNVTFSPGVKQTAISTEAQFLLMRYVFQDLDYRRYEWKCDSLNAPSLRAASRLGFQFEGIFRQAVVYKGRSRDTAWFSLTDKEWPTVCQALEKWLAPDNFDEQGMQRMALRDLREQSLQTAFADSTRDDNEALHC